MPSLLKVNTSWIGTFVGPALSVMYFLPVGTVNLAAAQASIDAVRDFWVACAPRMSSSSSWTVLGTVDQIDVTTGDLQGSFAGTARNGLPSGTGDVLPYQVQGMIRWDTGLVMDGRRLRGRTFLPATLEADNGGLGQPLTGYLTTMNTAAAALVASATADLAVYHRPIPATAPGGPRAGGAATAVTGTCSSSWKTLRSRAT